MAKIESLKSKLSEKLENEYNDFILELKKEKTEVIIERAYEKVCKEEIVYAFDTKDLSAKEYKALLKSSNILNECYGKWLDSDGNFNEILDYSVDKSIEHIVDNFSKETKNKKKEER